MRIKLILSPYLLIAISVTIALIGCINKNAYRKLENSYLPTKQVSPMSSKVRWGCGRDILFEPGDIKIHYAELVRSDDNCIKKTPPWMLDERYRNKQWATPNAPSETHLVHVCKNRKIPIDKCLGNSIKIPNTDPDAGAVNVWEVSRVRLDGVLSENGVTNKYNSERIHYAVYIVEGNKLPLGGHFYRRFSQGYIDDPAHRSVKSTFTTANGLKWKHARLSDLPQEGDKAYWLYEQTELYQADIGNYSILVYGIYSDPVYKFPDWLNKRQAFLREWINTFKIESLPADYVKKTPEEIQRMRDQEIEDAEALQAKHNASRKLRPSERLSAPMQSR